MGINPGVCASRTGIRIGRLFLSTITGCGNAANTGIAGSTDWCVVVSANLWSWVGALLN